MDHAKMKELIYSLYDGELDATLSQSVTAHLDGCLECQETFKRWSRTAKGLFRVPHTEPSEFFVTQVMERVRDLAPAKPTFGWRVSLPWLVPAVGFAMMILVVTPPAPSPGGVIDEFIFSNHAATADETLEYVMEG